MAANVHLCIYIAWILTIHVQDVTMYFDIEVPIVGYPSVQMSDWDDYGVASHGNDGDENTDYINGRHCTATDWESAPWWQVDLKYHHYVTKVDIKNRGDCCPERLRQVEVLMADETYRSGPTLRACGYREDAVPSGEWATIDCDQPTRGRYLTLRLPEGRHLLTVCEVKVYARFENTLTRVATATNTAGTSPSLVSQYQQDMILPSIDTELGSQYVSLGVSEKALFKSPLVDCSWDKIEKVRITLFKDEAEVQFLSFDTSTATDARDTFFSQTYLESTSYTDLSKTHWETQCQGNEGDFFNIEGQGPREGAPHERRFYINCNYGGCDNDLGWFTFLDMGHGNYCPWESNHGTNPLIMYSAGSVGTLATSWVFADVMTFTADMGTTFGGCISDCNNVADGDYQSCLACNIYVTCSSNSLKYKLCGHETSFDKDAGDCVSSSTTCTESVFASDGCYPNGCSPDPCDNSGTCSHDAEGWQCSCKPGYIGNTCGTDMCTAGGLCENGATCTRNNADSYTCTCMAGYEGDNCQTDIDDCSGNTCSGQGTCQDEVNDYTCTCTDGFTGKDCQIDPDGCRDDPCENNGVCTDADNGAAVAYTCACTADYTGSDCETQRICSSTSPCVNGACTDVGDEGTAYECDCDDGFVGTNCDVTDPCYQTSHCLNGGLCQLNGDAGDYYCQCPSGYLAPDCQYQDPCYTAPCQYGGTCTRDDSTTPPTKACACKEDFSGDDCETGPCDAASSPCSSSQDCTNNADGSGYVCTDNEQGLGSAGAQGGESTTSGSGIGAASPMVMYSLIAAVALAILIILSLIIIALRKKKQREEEDRLKEKDTREAWSKKMEEKEMEIKKAKNHAVIEKKSKQTHMRNLAASDVFADF